MFLELGCGPNKRAGFVGLDSFSYDGVDITWDLTKTPWPLESDSVEKLFSSHCLEHLPFHAPGFVQSFLSEVGRICRDGASLEIWTPYAFGRAAFLPGHITHFTEDIWRHWGVLYQELWRRDLSGWLDVQEFRYVVSDQTCQEEWAKRMSMDFAISHLHGIAEEFGIFAVFHRSGKAVPSKPLRSWTNMREGKRVFL